MLNSYDLYPDSNLLSKGRFETTDTDFALGIGVGSKFLTKSGFIFEIYGGIGRNLIRSFESTIEFVPRFGITLGKRF